MGGTLTMTPTPPAQRSAQPAISRRRFLPALGAGASLLAAGWPPLRAAGFKHKAVIIGQTGGGDYGHGFDTIFSGLENVSVEAVADPHPEGRRKAAERSGAKRQYADYRAMLEQERPALVSIAPRHPEGHKAMALAAIAAGAHVLIEKPFTEHLRDADEIVAAAAAKGVKIAVGHKNRCHADFARMKRLIGEGFLGTVLEMRVQGKQDRRSGGEDLLVLGTHDFDTMRFFFGDPEWCFAHVADSARPDEPLRPRQGREPMMVAGDTVRAMFGFEKNVMCSWQSVKAEEAWHTAPAGTERWGFTIFGTKRILSYYSLSGPLALDSPFLGHKTQKADWRGLPDPADWPPPAHETDIVKNLLHAIEHGTEPLCSGTDGRWTIEMVSAVYHSHRLDARVRFPLQDRSNPLLPN